jgi:ribonuclease D
MRTILFWLCCHLVNLYAKLKNEQNRSKNAQKVSKNEKYVKKRRKNEKHMLFRSRQLSMA